MKKKHLCALLALILCMAFVSPGLANAPPITVKVNGVTLQPDVPPQIINGRTMVPLSAIAGSLDCDVQWLPDLQQVSITSKTTTSNATIAITGPDDFRQVIQEALDKMPADNFALVARYIKRIIFEDPPKNMSPSAKAEMFSGRTCYINGTYFHDIYPDILHDEIIYYYLGLITHEANHVYIVEAGSEKLYSSQDREALCDFAALKAIKAAGGINSASYVQFKSSLDKELQY